MLRYLFLSLSFSLQGFACTALIAPCSLAYQSSELSSNLPRNHLKIRRRMSYRLMSLRKMSHRMSRRRIAFHRRRTAFHHRTMVARRIVIAWS